MNMFKIAMSSAAALGMVLAGTAANAESIRSGSATTGATTGVVSINKAKLLRTAAPAGRESKAALTEGSTLWIAALAAIAAGAAGYLITRDDNGKITAIDSPGA